MKNKFFKSIFPSILITLPIGSVYAFSLFSSDIANAINCSFKEIQFAFSLSIFFLGMGAAFGGSLVEKNITKSSLLATILFSIGLICTSIGISISNIWLIYLGYGCLCGIAQGIGYLTPVKTLIMWFPNNKGLASAISIISFGLGSSLCTILHKWLSPICGITHIFYALAAIYFVMMLIGSCIIRKPYHEHEAVSNSTPFNYKTIFKDKFFICAWLFMFLNISAGLALIGSSANIFKSYNLSAGHIVFFMMLAGLFNGVFRLVFACMADFFNGCRLNVWLIITGLSILLMCFSYAFPWLIVPSIILINACYGGGFSTLPSVLSEEYDLTCLSRVHGLVLSAWGVAGLIGNNISSMLYSFTGNFMLLPLILLAMYIINFVLTMSMMKIPRN